MPFADHLLQQPVNPSPFQDTPAYFCNSPQAAGSTFSQPPSPSLPTSGPRITPILKKIYNPYLEQESENILTMTLSQAPAFVCFYICTQSLKAAVLFLFCGDVGFSSQSSTTREHCVCQRLEPEVQECHFTPKIRKKERLKSSHCARNGNRQEWRMVGAKNRLAEELSGVTRPEKKE